MTEPRRVVLDMDVGIDDALAIVYLAARPDTEIVALGSVHGNIDVEQATRNALVVLERVGLGHVPVAAGASDPLRVPLRLSAYVHGDDGLGNVRLDPPSAAPTGEHAADQIVRLANERPGELDLLAVGPLTNLALALQRDPGVLGRYRSVVIMGGSGPEPDTDEGLEVDANIDHDPDAADVVFSAPGARLVMVGVNVTTPTILDEAALEAVAAADTDHARLSWAILQFYLDFYRSVHGRRVASMHDPLAAGVLRDPSFVTDTLEAPVATLRMEHGWRAVAPRHPGVGVVDRPATRVLTAVDGRRFIDDLVDALVRPLPPRAAPADGAGLGPVGAPTGR